MCLTNRFNPSSLSFFISKMELIVLPSSGHPL